MRLLATRKKYQNSAAIDPWTVVHFAAGLAAGLMELPRRPILGMAVGYEVLEQLLERHQVGQDLFETSGPEKAVNAAVDVAVLAAGHELGRRWNRT